MAKVKDILIHVIVETASRRRKCHRNKQHGVSAGHVCMVVKDGLNRRNYCSICAQEILALANTRLASIQKQLGL